MYIMKKTKVRSIYTVKIIFWIEKGPKIHEKSVFWYFEQVPPNNKIWKNSCW